MSVKTFNGLAIASMKTFNGRAAANVKTILGATVPAASSYIVSQDCDGGGIPTNAQAAGTLPDGWSNGTGTLEWIYSAAPLEGTYSWRCPSNATSDVNSYISPSGGPFSDVWAYALIRITANASVSGRGLFAWNTGLSSEGVGLFNGISNTRRLYCGTIRTNITLALNTTYSIWLHYVQGGGTAGADLLDFYSSTTTTIPGSPTASILTGDYGASVSALTLGRVNNSNGGAFLIDHIRASTSAIGSNPS